MWWDKKTENDAKASSQPTEPSASPSTTSAEQRYDGPRNKQDASAPFDPNRLPNREKLPPALQRIVDKQEKEENFFDELVDGQYVPMSYRSRLIISTTCTLGCSSSVVLQASQQKQKTEHLS